MEDYITRPEHDEFQKRIDEEHRRLNKRMDMAEGNIKEMNRLATSVEKLALNMENMLKEVEAQGRRLTVLEGRDGEMWRKAVGYLVTAVIGILVGYIFTRIGF